MKIFKLVHGLVVHERLLDLFLRKLQIQKVRSDFCPPPEGQGMRRFFLLFLGLLSRFLFLLLKDFLVTLVLVL